MPCCRRMFSNKVNYTFNPMHQKWSDVSAFEHTRLTVPVLITPDLDAARSWYALLAGSGIRRRNSTVHLYGRRLNYSLRLKTNAPLL